MLFRDYTLDKARPSVADAYTYIRDIDIKDPITELLIKVLAKNGENGNDENPIARVVTKIELTDGGTSLWTMDGEQCLVAARGTRGNLPPEYRSEWDNTYPFQIFPLHFGRWYGDTEYAFDPSRFKNPQVKVTVNLANVRAVSEDSAFRTGTSRIDIVARIMEGAPAPSKMFVVKEIAEWTGAATGTKRVELPVDWPYRLLIVRSFLTNSKPGTNIINLKMSCDADKFVPFDLPWDDVLRQEYSQYEMVHRVQELLVLGAELKDIHIGNCHEVVICPNNTESFMAASIWNECSAWCQGYNAIGSALDVDKGANLYSKGYQAEHAFLIPLGNKDIPESWFPTADYGDIELLLQERALAENSVALQQVMPY